MEYIRLSNQFEIPILGYGTLQINSKIAESCVINALKQGYRLIDTAASYFNEKEIGNALIKSKIDRKKVIICTKVWIQDSGYKNTLNAFRKSLERLQTDYIDIYLIHQPYGDYYGSWRAMEELYKQGKVRAIGVCNFSAERFVDLCENCTISPMINQVEFHPFFQQSQLLNVLKKYDCCLQAWGPLAEGQKDIFENPILKSIANKHDKSVAQIVLRWHVQNNIVAIPKTVDNHRMEENINVWDFKLDKEDMKRIGEMDIGHSEIIDFKSYKTAKWLNKFKIHD